MPTANCPTCQQQFDTTRTEAMPFCSDRCRQIDLRRWLDERHSVTVERIPDEIEDESADADE